MSMDINTLYNQYITDTTAANAKTSSIDKTVNKDMTNATDDKLMDVCKEFEAYFLEQIFKGMKDTVVPADEDSSMTMADYFEDNMYQQYAKDASEQGDYGIAQMLYEQMKRNYNL